LSQVQVSKANLATLETLKVQTPHAVKMRCALENFQSAAAQGRRSAVLYWPLMGPRNANIWSVAFDNILRVLHLQFDVQALGK
jgi:hypothetical protein